MISLHFWRNKEKSTSIIVLNVLPLFWNLWVHIIKPSKLFSSTGSICFWDKQWNKKLATDWGELAFSFWETPVLAFGQQRTKVLYISCFQFVEGNGIDWFEVQSFRICFKTKELKWVWENYLWILPWVHWDWQIFFCSWQLTSSV